MSFLQRINKYGSWFIDFLTVVLGLLTFLLLAIPMIGTVLLWLALVLLWPVVGFIWLGRLIRWYFNKEQPALNENRRHYALFPIFVLLLMFSYATNWPFRCMFWLHCPAFETLSTQVLSTSKIKGVEEIETPYRVGLYTVYDIEEIPGGLRLNMGDVGLFFSSEFIWFAFYPSGSIQAKSWEDSAHVEYSEPDSLNSQWYWCASYPRGD